MTNLRNVLDKLRANKAIASNLDKAQDLYSQKPYAQEWAEAYAAVERWHLLPSALSIVGASFAFTSVFTQLPWWLAVLIGLPFATLFELLKEWVTKMGFRSFFKLAKFNYLLLASIMLYACSVTLSTWGAYRAYTILEQDQRSQVLLSHSMQLDSLERHYQNLAQKVKSTNTQEKDSLLRVYDQRITESTEQLRAFEKQHDVNGVIAWKVRDTHGELVENINSLKNEKAKRGFSYQAKTDSSLNALKKEYRAVNSQLVASESGLLATVEEELGAYLWLVTALALLVEATIFAFRRFSEYYLYRSNQEAELITEGEMLAVDLDTITQLGQFLQLRGTGAEGLGQAVFGHPEGGHGKRIGFKAASKHRGGQEPRAGGCPNAPKAL